MKRTMFLSLALAAVVSAGCNDNARTETANNPNADRSIGTTGDADRNAVSRSDQDFIGEMVIANMAEVDLGKLALEKSKNADVRKFGQMMVDDHTKANESLKSIASAHGVTVSTTLDEKHRDLHDRLAKLNGAEFDREYISAMVDGHQDVFDTLGSRVDSANPNAVVAEKSDNVVTTQLNQWAAESYPVVQRHLETAKATEKNVGG